MNKFERRSGTALWTAAIILYDTLSLFVAESSWLCVIVSSISAVVMDQYVLSAFSMGEAS